MPVWAEVGVALMTDESFLEEEERLRAKEVKLLDLKHRFSLLMSLSDDQLRATTSNERVLPADPLYNSFSDLTDDGRFRRELISERKNPFLEAEEMEGRRLVVERYLRMERGFQGAMVSSPVVAGPSGPLEDRREEGYNQSNASNYQKCSVNPQIDKARLV